MIWLLLGALIGLLVRVAHLAPASWQQHHWLHLSGFSALAALGGGLLGIFLVGSPFSTWVALWFTVICTILLPHAIVRLGAGAMQQKR